MFLFPQYISTSPEKLNLTCHSNCITLGRKKDMFCILGPFTLLQSCKISETPAEECCY